MILVLMACTTRVNNPKRPQPGAIAVPTIDDVLPSNPGQLAENPDGAFAGSGDFLAALGASVPRHQAILTGVNAIGDKVNSMGLTLDVAHTEVIDGVTVQAIVRSDVSDANLRHVVLCADARPFYTATWSEGASGFNGTADIANDALQAFTGLAADDRQYVANLVFAKTAASRVVDLRLDGEPQKRDPFIEADQSRVLAQARFAADGEATAPIAYQEIQLWYDATLPADVTPQITVAGSFAADGSYEYAIHHVEAKLVCKAALDRANLDMPGWCTGYKQAADGATGAFTSATAAQAFWTTIKGSGLIDPTEPTRATPPTMSGACPE